MPAVGKKKQKKATYTANQLFMAFLAITGSFLLFAVWPETREGRHYDSFLASIGVKRGRIETTCQGSGETRTCGFVAKKNIEAGERVVQIPTETIISPQTILQEEPIKTIISPDRRDVFAQHGLADYMFSSYAMTFKLWWEMKLGSRSSMAAWIDLMPKKPSHGIYFTDEEAMCLDRASYEERNSTLANAKIFADVTVALCQGSSEGACASLDTNTIQSEFKWAVATTTQRIWGDYRQPMLLPVVDFAFPHPDLCNPDGDGDERCLGRNKQFFLQPKQEDDKLLVMLAQTMLLKGEKVYSLSQQRAPWETLVTFGYADHAALMVPDLLFLTQFHKFLQEQKIDIQSQGPDFPLKKCGERYMMSWSTNGVPKKELRDCWTALFWFYENPQYINWQEDANDAWRELQEENKVALARLKYLASVAIGQSAENVALYVVSDKGPACAEQTGNLPTIKASMDITKGIFQRAMANAEKKTKDAFKKWSALDESAVRETPLPVPPVKEEVDEVDEVVEDETDISSQ